MFISKTLNRFMFHKTKNKTKKYFCKSCLQCFSSKNLVTKHKEVCLSINGAQSPRLEKETTEFKNYFKQIPIEYKVYANFECNLDKQFLKSTRKVRNKHYNKNLIMSEEEEQFK